MIPVQYPGSFLVPWTLWGVGPWDLFRGAHWGPWEEFGGPRRPWRPKADTMEAEGQLNGEWGKPQQFRPWPA